MQISQKGSVILILFLTVLTIFVFGAAFLMLNPIYLENFKNEYLPDLTTSSNTPITTADPNKYKGWKELSNDELGITVKYPELWYITDNNTISQRAISSRLDPNQLANIITIGKHTGQFYDGYFNQDLFEEIYKNKGSEPFVIQYINTGDVKFYKLFSGRVASGQRYVIFRVESTNPADAGHRNIRAFILKDIFIYIFNLSYYNPYGIDTLKDVVSSAIIL